MNNKPGKIIVSHSGRQYVHHLLYSLQQYGFDYIFYTSFWYKPGQFPFSLTRWLPLKIRQAVEKELKKRYYDKIESVRVVQFPFFELLRELLDKIIPGRWSEYVLFWRDRIHDRWVSSKLNDGDGMVVGYEECSLKTFRKAKKLGMTTILDLAQVHYKEIDAISTQFPVFGEIYVNKKLRGKINKIKEEELALSDYIICLSGFARESLIKNGIAPEKIFVVHLGFDPLKFTPKKEYGLSGKLKLVYAGTLTRRKGIDLLLESIDAFSSFATLTLIGPMADAGDLIERHKGKFVWHAYLEQEEMNTIFNDSDVFVFPSYLDSWAMVVIEAMACGLPVIISDHTGARDAVQPESGFVTAAGERQALVNAIRFFAENRRQVKLWEKNHVTLQRSLIGKIIMLKLTVSFKA